jgi:hypothetical protein
MLSRMPGKMGTFVPSNILAEVLQRLETRCLGNLGAGEPTVGDRDRAGQCGLKVCVSLISSV